MAGGADVETLSELWLPTCCLSVGPEARGAHVVVGTVLSERPLRPVRVCPFCREGARLWCARAVG